MQLRGQRRIGMMRLARGDDPVHLSRSAARRAQSLLGRARTQRHFTLARSHSRHRFNPRALAQLPHRHAKLAVHFLRRNDPRAQHSARAAQERILRIVLTIDRAGNSFWVGLFVHHRGPKGEYPMVKFADCGGLIIASGSRTNIF